MALISDPEYMLHVLRLSHLRATGISSSGTGRRSDPYSARIISLSPTALASNPYIVASDLSDLDAWPEITTGLDSPGLKFDQEEYFNEFDRHGQPKRQNGDPGPSTAGSAAAAAAAAIPTTFLPGSFPKSPPSPRKRRARSNQSEEAPSRSYAKDPNVSLRYSKTLGKSSHLGLGGGITTQALREDSGEIAKDPTPKSTLGPATTLTDSNATPTPRGGPLTASPTRIRSRAGSLRDTPGLQISLASSTEDQTPIARNLTSHTDRFLGRNHGSRPRSDSAPIVGPGSLQSKRSVSSPGPFHQLESVNGTPRGSANRPAIDVLKEEQELVDSSSVTPTSLAGLGLGGPSLKTRQPQLRRSTTSRIPSRSASGSMQYSQDPEFSSAAARTAQAMGINVDPSNPIQDSKGNYAPSIAPPPKADPREWARYQSRFESILGQTLISQGLTEFSNSRTPFNQAPSDSLIGSPLSMGGTITSDSAFGHPEERDDEDDPELSRSESAVGDGRIHDDYGFGQTSAQQPASTMTFTKRIPGAKQPQKFAPSGLSSLFQPAATKDTADEHLAEANANPFAGPYASVPLPAGSSAPSLKLLMYFPLSDKPYEPIEITIRKEVKVEEVIGWSLAQYIEQGRTPALTENHEISELFDSPEDVWLTTAGWGLKMVEEDGEVDEDFPALDRDSTVAKFSFNAFAVVEASIPQIRANLARLPPRPKPSTQVSTGQSSVVTSSTAMQRGGTSTVASTYDSSFMGPSATYKTSHTLADVPSVPGGTLASSVATRGVMVLLRVRIVSSAGADVTTTINVPSEMYFADIIEVLCDKKRLDPPNPAEWVLVLADLSIVLPLDRTVESLMGNVDLALVRRTWAESRGLRTGGKDGERRGGDPNASIFKRPNEPSKAAKPNVDFASTYRKFIVQRRMPIGRHERIFAIDGDYIHIMPTDNKGFFDSLKTSSFHVTSIITCKQSSKSPSHFKVIVLRDGAEKRYDFEAENPKQAAEAVAALKSLQIAIRMLPGQPIEAGD